MRAKPAGVVVYETKPATEWILGGPVQKVSPKYAHSVLQGEMNTRLRAWAKGHGRVGVEWRFWVTPPGEESRYLVPDVAYLTYARLPREAREAAQEPQLAPDVAVEILSPDDCQSRVAHKIEVYLLSGSALVIVVDPQERLVRLHDRTGTTLLGAADRLEHAALAGFSLRLDEYFAELDT